MGYRIFGMKRGGFEGRDDRRQFIYAELLDEKGNTVISASLEYIIVAALDRGYKIDNLDELHDKLRNFFAEGWLTGS